MRAKSFVIAALALLLLAAPAWAGETAPAWIVDVHDGDTFTARGWFGEARKLRLACADAPEMESTRWTRQPHAQEALEFAALHLLDQWAAIEVVATSYGREVVRIKTNYDGWDLAASAISAGWAWAAVDYPYCRAVAKHYRMLEAQARAAKRGLWADPNPREPGKWRKGEGK